MNKEYKITFTDGSGEQAYVIEELSIEEFYGVEAVMDLINSYTPHSIGWEERK